MNCGWAGALEFCARCGQRNVPREQYDLRGLVGEYAMQVVGKMKIVRTLWTLFRHPGQLTAAFMDGKRIEQVNPLWLYLFVWSSVITLGQLVWQPESGELLKVLAGTPDAAPYIEAVRQAQPYWMGFISYASPLMAGLFMCGLVRAVFSDSWVECAVYTLQVQTVGLLIGLPATLATSFFGFWSMSVMWLTAFSLMLTLVAVLYEWFAVRRVFGSRVNRLLLRFVALQILQFGLVFVGQMLLGGGVLFGLIALFSLLGS